MEIWVSEEEPHRILLLLKWPTNLLVLLAGSL